MYLQIPWQLSKRNLLNRIWTYHWECLRRVLLSSIEGAAISSVKIEGVQHEFQSVEGIVEDVTDIVLNLKKVLFAAEGRDTVNLIIDVDKDGEVTAGDIELVGITVVNPEHAFVRLIRSNVF